MTYGQRAKLAIDLRDVALAYQRAEEQARLIFEGEFKADVLGRTGEFWGYQPESQRFRALADAVESQIKVA